MNTLMVNELFSSLQGEGRYAGYPVLFVRLAGCNMSCGFCDTLHNDYKYQVSFADLVSSIKNKKYGAGIVVFTGGEPLLQAAELLRFMKYASLHNLRTSYHLETNGSILPTFLLRQFRYIAFSPKNKKDLVCVEQFIVDNPDVDADIKIVTDLKNVNMDLIRQPMRNKTILMPLSILGDVEKTMRIKRAVWEYCVARQLRYSPRIQYDLFGDKRGV